MRSSQLFEIGRNSKNLSILYEDSLMGKEDDKELKQNKNLKESIDF